MQEAVRCWAPSEAYSHPPELENRLYANCVVSEAFTNPDDRLKAHGLAKAHALQFNAAHCGIERTAGSATSCAGTGG